MAVLKLLNLKQQLNQRICKVKCNQLLYLFSATNLCVEADFVEMSFSFSVHSAGQDRTHKTLKLQRQNCFSRNVKLL